MAIYKEDIVDINLSTGNIHRSFMAHSIGYKDQQADRFGIRVFRDGEAVDLTGVSVQGIFMPPQGDPIAITSGNIVEGNVAEVVLPQACYNYDGQFCLAIKLVDSTNSITGTIRIVDGVVDNTHASGTVAPTSAVPTYQEILSTYDAMVAATTAANTAATNCASIVAAPFAQATANEAGTYVTNEGKLYLLPNGHEANTTWANTTKTEVKVGGELSNLKSAFDTSVASIATPFSQLTAPIEMGTLCTRNNKVYRANRYIATVEWANAYFDEVPLGTELLNQSKSIRKNVSDSFELNGIAEKIEFVQNRYIDLSGQTANVLEYKGTSSSLWCAVKACSAGDKFFIKATGGTSGTINARAYGFVKSDGTVLEVAEENANVDGIYTAPANSAYLVINDRSHYDASYKGTKVNDIIGGATEEIGNEINKYRINNPVRLDYDHMPKDTTGYLDKSTGAVTAYANGYVSDFIPCIPGTDVEYNIFAIGNTSCAVAFYNAKKTLIDKVYSPTGGGTWVQLQGTTTAPAGTAYIRYGVKAGATEQYIQYTENVYPEKAITSNSFQNPWFGRNWIAFGTSITDGSHIDEHSGEIVGKYPKYLAQMSGMILKNRGYAGASIGIGGETGGNGYIYDRITNTDLSNADLISIEGFVNDFNYAIPLGNVGDTAQTTFCGALYMGITYCLENSSATVVVITDTTGRLYTFQDETTSDFRVNRVNNAGKIQKDFVDATKAVCEYLGVPCIDAGELAEINQFHPEYLADHIHQTELGGEQYAQTIWSILKQIKPRLLPET